MGSASNLLRWLKQPIVILLLAGGAGILLYGAQYDQTFPWASVKIRIDRPAAFRLARGILETEGFNLSGARQAASFWTDHDSLIYLEKRGKPGEARELISNSKLPIWGWTVRFFWPEENEEYRVSLDPEGRLISFSQTVLREKPLPSLKPDQALNVARRFLQKHFPFAENGYALVDRSSDQLIGRTDYRFRWKANRSPLETRTFLTISVVGDQVRSASHALELPDEFTRSEERSSSQRELLGSLFSHLDTLLTILTYLFLFRAWQRRWIRWRPALIFAGVLFSAGLLNEANLWPLAWFNYSTTQTIASFWSSNLLVPLFSLLGGATLALFLFAAADSVGRTRPDERYALGEIAQLKFLHTESFFTATLAGFGAAGIQLGFVVAFYWVGSRWFGFYSPSDVPFDDLLTTRFPWVSSLVTGLQPALEEESTYRLLAIPLLLHFFKRRWVAVLIPAVLWGFLHTGYYVEPIYARGLELTLVGIFFGWLFLRFGIWTTILSHYIYNATVSSTLLLVSENPYFKWSAIGVIALQAIPFIWAMLRVASGKTFLPLPFTRLAWVPLTREAGVRTERRKFVQPAVLRLRVPLFLAVGALAASVLLPVPWLKPDFDERPEDSVNRSRSFVEGLGFHLDGYLSAARFETNAIGMKTRKYIERHIPPSEVEPYLRRHGEDLLGWKVRWYKPGESTEYFVRVEKAGGIGRFNAELDENLAAPAASPEQTKKVAEGFLIQRGLNAKTLSYNGATETEQPNRKDLTHRWTDPAADIGELRRTIYVDLSGPQVSGFGTYFEVPEKFLREEVRKTFYETLRNSLLALAMLATVFLVLRAAFDRSLQGRIWGKLPFVFGLIGLTTAVVDWINRWPLLWTWYPSATSVSNFALRSLLSLTWRAGATAIAFYVSILLLTRISPSVFESAPGLADLSAFFRRAPWKWRNSRECFMWALALLILDVTLERLFEYLGIGLHHTVLQPADELFSTLLPPLAVLGPVITTAMKWSGVAILVGASIRYFKTWIPAIFLLLVAESSGAISGGEWSVVAFQGTRILIYALVLREFIGFHLPFFVWYALLASTLPLIPWLGTGTNWYSLQAWWVMAPILILTTILFILAPPRSIRRAKLEPIPNES